MRKLSITFTLGKLLLDSSPSKLVLAYVTFVDSLLDFLCLLSSESPHFTLAKQGKIELLILVIFETLIFILVSSITSLFLKHRCITSLIPRCFQSRHKCAKVTVQLSHFYQKLLDHFTLCAESTVQLPHFAQKVLDHVIFCQYLCRDLFKC